MQITAAACDSARARASIKKKERSKASVRAKVEPPFRVVKRQFSLLKVGFGGLAKSTAHTFALSNLWVARKQWIATTEVVRPSSSIKQNDRSSFFQELPE